MNVTMAQIEDVSDLLDLVAEYQEQDETVELVDDERNTKYLEQFIADPQRGVILIGRTTSGNQPAGFITLCRKPSTLHAEPIVEIIDLFVSEPHRGHGFGRQFFNHAVRWTKAQKLHRMIWYVENLNMPGQYVFDVVEQAHHEGCIAYALNLNDIE